jgi:hypothetical protein
VGLNDSLPDGATPLCDPFPSPTGLDPPLPHRQRPPRAAAALHHRSAASRPGRHQRFACFCACWLISRCGSLRPTKGFKEAPASPSPGLGSTALGSRCARGACVAAACAGG